MYPNANRNPKIACNRGRPTPGCPAHKHFPYVHAPANASGKVLWHRGCAVEYPKKLHHGGRFVKQGRLAAPGPKPTVGNQQFAIGGPGKMKTVIDYGASAPGGSRRQDPAAIVRGHSARQPARLPRSVAQSADREGGQSIGQSAGQSEGSQSKKRNLSDMEPHPRHVAIEDNLAEGTTPRSERTSTRPSDSLGKSHESAVPSSRNSPKNSFESLKHSDSPLPLLLPNRLGSTHSSSRLPSREDMSQPISLHQSEVAINLKIKDLGDDFKRKRILSKLNLLKHDRGDQSSKDHKGDIVHFEEEVEDEENTAVRACSTCKNSLDYLECSKAENKRKSFAKWQTKESADITSAIYNMETTNYGGKGKPGGNGLHESKVNLNLKIQDLENHPDFKKNKILAQLKLLDLERGLQKDEISSEKKPMVEISDPAATRPCSTCENSLELLTCTKEDNQRKSFAMWMARDEADLRDAYKRIGSNRESEKDKQVTDGSFKLIDIDDGLSSQKGDFLSHEQAASSASSVSCSEDESRDEIVVNQSQNSLNLKIKDLGADFKQRRILERLRLLKIDRSRALESDEDDGEETPARPCSTCKTDLDLLECSKEENQRKSIARWQARESSDYRRAIHELESANASKPP